MLIFQSLILPANFSSLNALFVARICGFKNFRQFSIANAPCFADAELVDDCKHGLEFLIRAAHPPLDPSVIVWDRTSRRHPHQSEKAVIRAIFHKREVRCLGFEVCGVEWKVWQSAHRVTFVLSKRGKIAINLAAQGWSASKGGSSGSKHSPPVLLSLWTCKSKLSNLAGFA